MAQFRFYITELDDGKVVGTNKEETARSYAQSDDYFVVDAEKGTWLLDSGENVEIACVYGETLESPSPPCDPSQDGG